MSICYHVQIISISLFSLSFLLFIDNGLSALSLHCRAFLFHLNNAFKLLQPPVFEHFYRLRPVFLKPLFSWSPPAFSKKLIRKSSYMFPQHQTKGQKRFLRQLTPEYSAISFGATDETLLLNRSIIFIS